MMVKDMDNTMIEEPASHEIGDGVFMYDEPFLTNPLNYSESRPGLYAVVKQESMVRITDPMYVYYFSNTSQGADALCAYFRKNLKGQGYILFHLMDNRFVRVGGNYAI